MIVFHLYESAGYWAGRPVKHDIDVLCLIHSSSLFLLRHLEGETHPRKAKNLVACRDKAPAPRLCPEGATLDLLMKRSVLLSNTAFVRHLSDIHR
jgi:hypothetical protein